MKTVTVLVLDGMFDSSLSITLDTLRAAQSIAARGGAPQVRVRTIAAKACVTTGAGLRLKADLQIKAAKQAESDWIIVPGLGYRSDRELGECFARGDTRRAMSWLAAEGAGKAKIAASCSAAFLLAQAGLLNGRKATTAWWLAPAFRARYPDVTLDEARILVRDGPCLTAGAALSQLDLMLAIVSDVLGESVAHLCSRYLLIDQRSSQARYMMRDRLEHVDQTVVAAERWIDAHLARPMTVTALSSELALSPKTLARRIEAATGVSPIKFIQRRRLSHAAHLLETTALSIEAVAARVGYQDSTALRKLIKREFGVTPSTLR
ncbi:GlxA family transcriptional regulator [Pseudoduganella namucuonensis]|uniref:Transcriptional regulator GlxA family, contains an amidase domain and an AraC-type DNA-binding HTH domain n=1 Tax=Pseudoduganella namucuonensis TaxID=1035707 RepID=A0A1I7M1S3_9BURK|nr:helix-turn-helix domain-containing protein [Pseudoduganella namucuonensis]SFV15886.1 Transcriptional regulator GlxA family, contains an amidase domain and an AraC-type DNA-binding HTH domain [Pseudoduganella namucuonensis]